MRFARIATTEPTTARHDMAPARNGNASQRTEHMSVQQKTKTSNIATAKPRNAARSDTISRSHLRCEIRRDTAKAAAAAGMRAVILSKSTATRFDIRKKGAARAELKAAGVVYQEEP